MKTNLKHIKHIGSKFTGVFEVTKLEIKNGTTLIRVENDSYYHEREVCHNDYRGTRYNKLFVGDEVVANYNSWDGLCIKGIDKIYPDAWEDMSVYDRYLFDVNKK